MLKPMIWLWRLYRAIKALLLHSWRHRYLGTFSESRHSGGYFNAAASCWLCWRSFLFIYFWLFTSLMSRLVFGIILLQRSCVIAVFLILFYSLFRIIGAYFRSSKDNNKHEEIKLEHWAEWRYRETVTRRAWLHDQAGQPIPLKLEL
jgi:hypothetical protein